MPFLLKRLIQAGSVGPRSQLASWRDQVQKAALESITRKIPYFLLGGLTTQSLRVFHGSYIPKMSYREPKRQILHRRIGHHKEFFNSSLFELEVVNASWDKVQEAAKDFSADPPKNVLNSVRFASAKLFFGIDENITLSDQELLKNIDMYRPEFSNAAINVNKTVVKSSTTNKVIVHDHYHNTPRLELVKKEERRSEKDRRYDKLVDNITDLTNRMESIQESTDSINTVIQTIAENNQHRENKRNPRNVFASLSHAWERPVEVKKIDQLDSNKKNQGEVFASRKVQQLEILKSDQAVQLVSSSTPSVLTNREIDFATLTILSTVVINGVVCYKLSSWIIRTYFVTFDNWWKKRVVPVVTGLSFSYPISTIIGIFFLPLDCLEMLYTFYKKKEFHWPNFYATDDQLEQLNVQRFSFSKAFKNVTDFARKQMLALFKLK